MSTNGEIEQFDKNLEISTLTEEVTSKSNAIEIPQIELPKGGGAIKGIDEKFEVNAANGTASLSVPLPVTQGNQGFAPALSLNYNSGSGNSPYGLGWSLGLSQISRKTDKGIPKYTNEDVYTMSGTEDLVPFLVEIGDGDWKKEIKNEGEYTVSRYRPRITSDHSRIELIEHPAHGKYWRVTTAQNVVTIYGRSAATRISDPENTNKIFTWLPEFSYDDRGNWIEYRYKAEDLNQVPNSVEEKHRHNGLQRFSNRYLKRVRYGNAIPYIPDPNFAYDPIPPEEDNCYYELVLDYGEHNEAVPLPSEEVPWAIRKDAFSTYRSGFEIRVYRLCQRVLMFHHFPEEQNQDGSSFGENYLVRSLEFIHGSSGINNSDDAEVNYLGEIIASGYVRKGDGSYSKKSLPAISMDYQSLDWNTEIKIASPSEVKNMPEGLGGNYQWVDLYGEGINGLLTEQGNGWYYKENLGDSDDDGRVQFGNLKPVFPKPNFNGLGSTITVADLDADGLKEIVTQSGGVQGYYSMGKDGNWEPFRPFIQLANLNENDPNVRTFDITGDGKPDLVMTEERVINFYRSEGKKGYAPNSRAFKALEEENGPALVFSDAHNKIMLADMSGDGLTDIVRIRNKEICYWPNMGYGHFGAKVNMGNVPQFDLPDQFDADNLMLADVSGTGATDIIYKENGKFKAYLNLSGNRLSAPQIIAPFFPSNGMVNLKAVDLLGTGTTCLVWSSRLPADSKHPLRYIDLLNSRKPYVMTGYRNNMGMSNTLNYRSSTYFYLKDKIQGTPWITKLPFPVQVVERSTTTDEVMNVRFSTEYKYHHGFYDHQEREFRGFGMVEQIDSEQYTAWKDENQDSNLELSEETFQPPLLTRTWYHTGAFFRKELLLNYFKNEYWNAKYEAQFPGELGAMHEPELPDAVKVAAKHIQDVNILDKLTATEHREASRACKGMVLRTEIFDLKAQNPETPTDEELRKQMLPYQVAAHNCQVILQQPKGKNTHACFQVLEKEAFTVNYEQDITDPRISHNLNIAMDQYGNVLESASIAYARFSPDVQLPQKVREEQAKTHVSYTRNGYTNNDVINPANYRLRMLCESETYELRNIHKNDKFYTLTDFTEVLGAGTDEIPYLQAHSNVPERRKIEHTATLFLQNDLSTPLAPGHLESKGFTFESYALAYTSKMIDQLFPPDFFPAQDYPGTDAHFVHYNNDGNWWVPSGKAIYLHEGESEADSQSRFYTPIGYRDAGGSETHISFYKNYHFLIESTTDAMGNTTKSEAFNFRTISPVVLRDANDNLTATLPDELGMLKATAFLGKDLDNDGIPELQLADSLNGLNEWTDDETAIIQTYFQATDAGVIASEAHKLLKQSTSRFVYDLNAWTKGKKPSVSSSIARKTHQANLDPGEESILEIAFEFTAGLGSVVMNKVMAEPGLAKDTIVNEDGGYLVNEVDTSPHVRWLGNGRSVFNNKGKTVKQYQPYFSVTPFYEDAAELIETGANFILYYDSQSRHIRTLLPDGAIEEIRIDAWKKEVWDKNDMALQSKWYTDRFNRLIDAALTADGKDPVKEQMAAVKTATHNATPTRLHFDSLGRSIVIVTHNKRPDNSDEFMETTIDLDLEGNTLAVRDPRGNTVMSYHQNMLGARVQSKSMDAGERWNFANATGKLKRNRDSRNHTSIVSHDALHREIEKKVIEGDGDAPLNHVIEKLIYGEGKPNDKSLNLRGRLYHHYDTGGKIEIREYDRKGKPKVQLRKVLQENKALHHWPDANPDDALIAVESHQTTVQYDALERITQKTNPDGSIVFQYYNARGKLNKVEVDLGGNKQEYVKNITYNEKGQRGSIIYGNDVKTTYVYDKKSFRQLSVISRRKNNELLQELHYTYDAVGNIIETEDRAVPTRFFANEVIETRNLYTYDAVYRLIEAHGKEHVAQANHTQCDTWNELPFKKQYNPNDDMLWRNYTEHYAYDLAGNILELQHIASGGSWTRTYTYEGNTNRLIQTQVGDRIYNCSHHAAHGYINALPHLQQMNWNFRDELSSTVTQRICTDSNPETTSYVYSGSGKRLRKITENESLNGEAASLKEERLYVGDVEIYTKGSGSNAGLKRTTLHISDDTGRIAMIDVRNDVDDGTEKELVRYQLSTHTESVCLELDNAGAVISYEEYHPFGTTAYQAVNTIIKAAAKRYRYTGMERDDETGFSYHNARYYIPWLGRWLKPDASGIKDGINLYSYVKNNPINLKDPTGMYGEAGHFYTVYYVSLAAGFDEETAFRNAFYAQLPDEVEELDAVSVQSDVVLSNANPINQADSLLESTATMIGEASRALVYQASGGRYDPGPAGIGDQNMEFARLSIRRDNIQKGLHVLTGESSASERAFRSDEVGRLTPGSLEFGLNLHAFGDSYAHSQIDDPDTLYETGWGHASELWNFRSGHSPDIIPNRRALYNEYVTNLYTALRAEAADQGLAARMTLQETQQFATDVGEDVHYTETIYSHVAVVTIDRTRQPTETEQIGRIRQMTQDRTGVSMRSFAPENHDTSSWSSFAPSHAALLPSGTLRQAERQASSWANR